MDIPILRPIAHKTPKYREIAYQAIKEAILSGQLRANTPLVEEQIASMLQISRTPVREAMAILEHEGLLGPQGGRGLCVRTLTKKEFVEIFNANEIVEPDLARRAAHLVSEEQLQLLSEAVSRGRYFATEGNFNQFLHYGREFHRLLGLAAENDPLTDFIVRNEERVDLYLISSGKTSDIPTMQASVRQHEAILEALIQRDPDEAAHRVIFHAQSVRQRFADLFSDEARLDHQDDIDLIG
jgi:DNA-binding GntR family transcriptional regulator